MAKQTRSANIRKKGGDVSQEVYDGAAKFGMFMATIWLIVGNLIALALIIGGIYLMTRKEKYTGKTVATVKSVQCNTYNDGKSVTYNCSMILEYNVNGRIYSRPYQSNSSISQYDGMLKPIRYDPANPNDYIVFPLTKYWIGVILLVIGLLIMIGAWFTWYIVRRFKTAAAAYGVGSAWDIAT